MTTASKEQFREELMELFDARDIRYIRLELWEWVKAVGAERAWTFRGNPASVLELERIFRRMSASAYASTYTKVTADKKALADKSEDEKATAYTEVTAGKSGDKTEDESTIADSTASEREYFWDLPTILETYSGTIRRLRLAETKDPGLFFNRFFQYQDLEAWYEMLEYWREYGLSNYCPDDYAPDLEAYELLEGLLEAMYLLEHEEDVSKKHLDPTVRLLIEAIQPEMVFELKSESLRDGDDRVYQDLIVVMSDHRSFAEVEPLIEFTTFNSNISCLLKSSGDFHQKLKEGNLYLSQRCTSRTLVHTNGVRTLPDPSPYLSEIKNASNKVFESGMARARSFYESAGRQVEPGLAMYMFQQATELTFRTVALAMYGMEKKSHRLGVLLGFNRRIAPGLNAFFPSDTEVEVKLVELLDRAYIEGRYGELGVDEKMLGMIKERVGGLLDGAEGLMENEE